jgi:hypothetical protein
MRSLFWISWRVSCHGECLETSLSSSRCCSWCLYLWGQWGNSNRKRGNGDDRSMALGHWGRGTGAGATGAMARGMGQRLIDHCHCNRSCGCGGPWGAGEFALFKVLIQKVSECQMEVLIKEWCTCLTTLTRVYSGLFGLSLVNALSLTMLTTNHQSPHIYILYHTTCPHHLFLKIWFNRGGPKIA